MPIFSSLLSNLQTLISSRFLLTSFFPTLGFWFANAVMLYFWNEPFRTYVDNSTEQKGLFVVSTGAILIAVAATSYAEAALLPSIQALMEGNWPILIRRLLAPAQMAQYIAYETEIRKYLRLRGEFMEKGEPKAEIWKAKLTKSREIGCQKKRNGYIDNTHNQSANKIKSLAWLYHQSLPIAAIEIDEAVRLITAELENNNADELGSGQTYFLEEMRQLVWDIIDYAALYPDLQYRSLITKSRFRFGTPPLAPTRMGNVAATVQSYTVSRYNFNFEFFWSRLQVFAQRDKDFGPTLQAAKTQFDFLVSLSALTYLWTLVWTPFLYLTHSPTYVFLGAALLGPLSGYLWYRIAVAQYQTLADLLRGSVDLFRLDLLAMLRHASPGSVKEERYYWEKIDAMHGLYEIDDLQYVKAKS